MKTDVKQFLHNLKLKATPARVKILAFLGSIEKPVSIKEIHKSIGSKLLDQATIYRTLEIFKTLDVVVPVDFGDGKQRFELKFGHHHHHMVCTNCEKIEDIQINDHSWIAKILKEKKFEVKNHSFEFFGLCNNCAK